MAPSRCSPGSVPWECCLGQSPADSVASGGLAWVPVATVPSAAFLGVPGSLAWTLGLQVSLWVVGKQHRLGVSGVWLPSQPGLRSAL